MARKGENFQIKAGRYFARHAIPRELQPILGKREFSQALGADREAALNTLPEVLAGFKREIAAARSQIAGGRAERPAPRPSPRRKLSPVEIAAQHLQDRLAYDAAIRDTGSKAIGLGFPDEQYVADLREIAAGRILDPLPAPLALALEWSTRNGNLQDAPGSPAWNATVRMLARAELAALDTSLHRDEGESDPPTPADLIPAKAAAEAQPATASRILGADSLLPLSALLPRFLAERRASPPTAREYEVVVRQFEEAMGEAMPVHAITRRHAVKFKDLLLKTPSSATKRFPGKTLLEAIEANNARKEPYPCLDAKTLNDKSLSRFKTLLGWCANNDLVPDNPATGIRVETVEKAGKAPREDFTPGDLAKLFAPDLFAPAGALDEFQWAMLIGLFSGLRPSEAAQMRLDSVRHERGVLCLSVEEETKNKGSRRLVPVHSALIELGLERRVAALRKAGEEHLFPVWYRQGTEARAEAERNGSTTLNQYFPRFIPRRFNVTYKKNAKITEPTKDFYSFRHTFKTGLRKSGVDKGTADYICGHADQSAGAVYVHGVSIEAMKAAVESLNFDGLDLASLRKIIKE
ncbi:tyrosine-type recombinase/integrase [Xanthobacter wiegelii]|uniref:tyrosine-type recombinase/integrase n=1 Tax=Xanthobacter wiegelii TaxID=3119913 RepID=UPI003728B9F5